MRTTWLIMMLVMGCVGGVGTSPGKPLCLHTEIKDLDHLLRVIMNKFALSASEPTYWLHLAREPELVLKNMPTSWSIGVQLKQKLPSIVIHAYNWCLIRTAEQAQKGQVGWRPDMQEIAILKEYLTEMERCGPYTPKQNYQCSTKGFGTINRSKQIPVYPAASVNSKYYITLETTRNSDHDDHEYTLKICTDSAPDVIQCQEIIKNILQNVEPIWDALIDKSRVWIPDNTTSGYKWFILGLGGHQTVWKDMIAFKRLSLANSLAHSLNVILVRAILATPTNDTWFGESTADKLRSGKIGMPKLVGIP